MLFALVVLGACGESYRVEPLLLENQEIARGVVANYKDADRVDGAEAVVARFVKSVRSGDCQAAWEQLSSRYRARFAEVAGQEDARGLFCEGYKVQGDMLVKGDWVEFLLGDQAFYMTTVPPELGLQASGSEELLYVVQRDGSYRALLLVKESGSSRLEPF